MWVLSKPVVITADSTVDLSPELVERFQIKVIPLTIVLGDESFLDGVHFTPIDMYKRYHEDGTLPKTSAPGVQEFLDFFTPLVEAGNEVVHLDISAELSNSYNAARLAAAELEGVYVVDSRMLSTGVGLLAIEGAECRDQGMTAWQIARHLESLTGKVETSFVLDTLEFMHKGGRCSSVSLLGANLLNIKPSIVVKDGAMSVAKKYRGKDDICRLKYMQDRLKEYEGRIDTRRIVLHTTCDFTDKERKRWKKELKKLIDCEEIIVSTAGCVITSHCGPGTFALFFMLKYNEPRMSLSHARYFL